ncbi:hypothetical protein D5086_008733 [Populus alba]|uniref:Uncharacterized protein n=1 Tax=Populus alba TaxID=43335 RepID=A0ACC4CHV0_POPAL
MHDRKEERKWSVERGQRFDSDTMADKLALMHYKLLSRGIDLSTSIGPVFPIYRPAFKQMNDLLRARNWFLFQGYYQWSSGNLWPEKTRFPLDRQNISGSDLDQFERGPSKSMGLFSQTLSPVPQTN